MRVACAVHAPPLPPTSTHESREQVSRYRQMPVARIKLMIIGLFGGVQGHSDGRGEVAVETSRHLASQLAMEQAGSNDATGVIHVSTPTLVLTAIPLFFIAFLGHRLDLGLTNELIIGVIRCFVQLMILGMILHPIFVMGMGWPWLVGLCEYLSIEIHKSNRFILFPNYIVLI